MTTPQGKVPINYRVNECHVKVSSKCQDVIIELKNNLMTRENDFV
jgi:hypothetical protein